MTKPKFYLIILSLLIVVSISSFFWLRSILVAVERGYATKSQLSFFSQLGLRKILYIRFYSIENKDKNWLNIARVLAKNDGNLAYVIAKYHLQNQSNKEAKLWLLQAIRLKHHKARLLLANIHTENGENQQAKNLLQSITDDILAVKLLLTIAIIEGENTLIARYARQFKELDLASNSTQKLFYLKLEKYNIIDNGNAHTDKSCELSIAPFATNLKNLDYLAELITSPKLAPFSHYICFTPVNYISKQRLNCLHDQDDAITCDESIWENKLDKSPVKPRYLIVLVDEGGANVNDGILYLDANDTEKVLIHELAHLLGFVDEYPLPKNHLRCQGRQQSMFSHNIAVLPRYYHGTKQLVREEILAQLPWAKYISDTTPLMKKTTRGWVLGTEKSDDDTIGGFIAETCIGSDFVSVKPVNKITAMRYFEKNIPSLYFQFLSDNPQRFLMPSYSQNVKAALMQKKITP